jgi:YidC/Oxa1 family membrane protein insertase
MFDFILFPVSAILWFWHTVFGAVLGAASGISWVLAIGFLVFTLRALLIKPALSQLRAGRAAQKLAPQIKKLQKKYANDRQRMAQEIQKLHAENGSSMFGGCLPMLIQLPVFLSLYWVLRGFTPDAGSNQIFDRGGVESFLGADLFGAKLGNWVSQPAAVLAEHGTDKAHMLAVGVPLMLIAGLATFFSMRLSMKRQAEQGTATNPQLAGITKVMAYLAPVGILGSGLFFPVPIAVLLYFLATNGWTLGQTHLLSRKVDREEDRARAETATKKKVAAPKPGQKPTRAKR